MQKRAVGSDTQYYFVDSQLRSPLVPKLLAYSCHKKHCAIRLYKCNKGPFFRKKSIERTNCHEQVSVGSSESSKITYLHNALGQRVFKSEPQIDQTAPDETTLGTPFIDWLKKNFGWLFAAGQANATLGQTYLYADGQLPDYAMLGEYGNGAASGAGRTEYIYLPTDSGTAIPIGIFRSNRLFAVHTDHLATPRQITDDANKTVWQWPYSAFGDNKPTGILKATANPNNTYTQDPTTNARLQATGVALSNNPRFAGQYFDSESNLNQNFNRSYSPNVGAYTQMDPIGLGGGLNRRGYVEGNALMNIDPFGLCQCTAIPDSKESCSIPTWFGHERKVTGKYTCETDDKKTEIVKATHEEWYLRKDKNDNGKEGNLLGQQYGKSTFNGYNYRYTYPQKGFQSFDPKSSAAPELQNWAKQCNCK